MSFFLENFYEISMPATIIIIFNKKEFTKSLLYFLRKFVADCGRYYMSNKGIR